MNKASEAAGGGLGSAVDAIVDYVPDTVLSWVAGVAEVFEGFISPDILLVANIAGITLAFMLLQTRVTTDTSTDLDNPGMQAVLFFDEFARAVMFFGVFLVVSLVITLAIVSENRSSTSFETLREEFPELQVVEIDWPFARDRSDRPLVIVPNAQNGERYDREQLSAVFSRIEVFDVGSIGGWIAVATANSESGEFDQQEFDQNFPNLRLIEASPTERIAVAFFPTAEAESGAAEWRRLAEARPNIEFVGDADPGGESGVLVVEEAVSASGSGERFKYHGTMHRNASGMTKGVLILIGLWFIIYNYKLFVLRILS